MKLTSLSKIIVVSAIIVLFFFVMFTACNSCNRNRQAVYVQPQQQVVYQDANVGYVNGQPSTVVVQTDNGSSVIMNYLIWRSLMDQGGTTQVNNYYNSHRNDPEFQSDAQARYRRAYDDPNTVKKTEKVQTTQSNGFGNRPVPTNQSNGFGNKPVNTNKSNGFGSPATNSTPKSSWSGNVSTKPSSGFGSSTPSTSTRSSSEFGSSSSSSKPTTTKPSGGFGKRN